MNKLTILIIIAVMLGGCAVDPLEDRNPVQADNDITTNPEAIRAWLWTYSTQVDSLCVFHTIDKQCWESFQLDINPNNAIYRGGLVGGGIYPTLWFWNNNTVTSLTNGILDHGDHGHIVHPVRHAEIEWESGFLIADMSATPNGERIIICAAGQSWPHDSGHVVSINYLTGDTTRYPVQSRITYVVAGNDRIVTGNAQSRTARIISLGTGSIISTISTDTLVADGVYHGSTETAFLAGRNRIDVVDMQSGSITETITYAGNESITRMISAPEGDYALALIDTGGATDFFTVLDIRNRTMDRNPVAGASLTQSVSGGTIALSDDGSKAILADAANALLYRVTLADGTVEQVVSPDTACPVACNWDATRVWALAQNKVYQISFENDAIVDSISVPPGTTRIMVTSFRDNSALFDSNDHTF
ncbi:MAG: hypothetical protein GF398_00365 [Chitinivibrionales bacterium]|nr:hypothetical protein [Chitinivibrionales bacterium]